MGIALYQHPGLCLCGFLYDLGYFGHTSWLSIFSKGLGTSTSPKIVESKIEDQLKL